jgi:hypothetical protein
MLDQMRHRVWAAALLLIVLVGLAASAPLLASGSPHASVARCGSASGHTLAADRVARVYAVGDTVYGCAKGGARPYVLGHRRTCVGSSRVAPVKLAARIAAYGLERCGVDTGSTQVIVRRLTDGSQMHAQAATSPPGAESFQSVDSLVVKSDGAVAWIATGSSIVGGRKTIEVRRADRAGAALLDSGAEVVTHSLRLHRSTLSWKHGATSRTAALH